MLALCISYRSIATMVATHVSTTCFEGSKWQQGVFSETVVVTRTYQFTHQHSFYCGILPALGESPPTSFVTSNS